jgi:hypothetical protein
VLGLHVDYWNGLGWTDPFSRPAFAQRQREAALRSRRAIIYTPQVVLDGKDLPAWNDAVRFASSVADINDVPAAVDIRAAATLNGATLHIDGELHALEGVKPDGAAVWIAVYENHLVTRVAGGENGGRTLEHDYVVRALLGPISFGEGGVAKLDQGLSVDATWNRGSLGVAIFAQAPASGSVLQAISASNCL